jgi:hypothetical protein
MSICDFVFSADMVVPNRAQTLDALMNQIGLASPPPDAHKYFPNAGWDITFAPVNPERARAPTTIEIMTAVDLLPSVSRDPGQRSVSMTVADAQAFRRWRTHATVIVTSELDAIVERVSRSGRRHWFQAPPANPGFPRLWMGVGDHHDSSYDPSADCGLRLEFIPRGASKFSVADVDTSPDVPRPGQTGIRRVAFRDFLVPDLGAALRDLETTFGWEPAHDVREEPSRGYSFVEMSGNYPQGAQLRLIQPIDPASRAGQDAKGANPSPYTIVCSVHDLDATEADLKRRNTPYVRLPAGKHEPETLSVLSPDLGAPFAFIARAI